MVYRERQKEPRRIPFVVYLTGDCEIQMKRTTIGLVAVFTNNFVTCRRIVQENVVRPSVKIVSCKQPAKLTEHVIIKK